jgi:hypothetical protein
MQDRATAPFARSLSHLLAAIVKPNGEMFANAASGHDGATCAAADRDESSKKIGLVFFTISCFASVELL